MPKKVCIHLEKVEKIIKGFNISHDRNNSVINGDGKWETLWGEPSLVLKLREGEFSIITGDKSFIKSSSEYHSSKIRRCSSSGGTICEWNSSENIVVLASSVNETASLLTRLKREIISVVEDCNCENAEDLGRKVSDLYGKNSNLTRNSVSKEIFDELMSEYKKNIEDYNNLVKNSVKKEAFESLETECKQNIKDYNELVGEHKELAEKCRNLIERLGEYEEYKEKYENTRNEREGERVNNARVNTRLEERLESSNAKVVDLTRRLENSENQLARLEIRSDEKNVLIQNLNNQLTDLRIEGGEKDSRLREKEVELTRKNEEIERLKERTGLSQEELLNEKLRSEKGNLDLFASQLEINLEQIYSLVKYHERLFVARKNHNQANIDIHEGNIARVKQEFSGQGINIINIREVCQKCERIAEFCWELEQVQQQYQAQQEQPTNNI